MKKIVTILFIMILIGVSNTAFGANSVNISIDNVPIEAKGIIVNGRTLLPLRDVAEACNIQVYWKKDTQDIMLTGSYFDSLYRKQYVNAYLKIGRPSMSIEYMFLKDLDVAPQIINGKTMMPIRPIAETYGKCVFWNRETNTVQLYSSYELYQKAIDNLSENQKQKIEAEKQKQLQKEKELQEFKDTRDRLGGTIDQAGYNLISCNVKQLKLLDKNGNITYDGYVAEGAISTTSDEKKYDTLKVCVFDVATNAMLAQYDLEINGLSSFDHYEPYTVKLPNFDEKTQEVEILLAE